MSTTATLRDPKTDPQPGDRLRKQNRNNNWTERQVIRREDQNVIWHTRPGSPERRCYMMDWLEWTNEAEVISDASTG